jgi:hypothetical protein
MTMRATGTRRYLRWTLPSGPVVALLGCAAASLATGHAARGETPDPPTPVLVELFTSEGCSSCPSAEDELVRLASQQPIDGARIVPLAFHVDYWDRLGWTDPFSSPVWTARQGDYARGRSGGLYTPEAVVQGGRDCVGSNDGELRGLVRAAAGASTAKIEVTRASAAPGAELRVVAHVGALPIVDGADRATLMLALTESGVSVAVRHGENGGRTLAHAPLVRDLQTVALVPGRGGAFEASLSMAGVTRRENLEVVAFVQVATAGRVIGVGTMRPFATRP